MFTTIQLDLTALGRLIKEYPNLTKKVNLGGEIHQMLDATITDRKNPKTQFDLNVSCKPKDIPFDVKWFIGSGCSNPKGKKSPTQSTSPALPADAPVGNSGGKDELPF